MPNEHYNSFVKNHERNCCYMFYLAEKLFKFLLNVGLVLMCILSIYLFGQRLNGIHHPKILDTGFGIIMSGSMEPALPTGSVVVIREQDAYQEGDIITYINRDDVSITHRIYKIEDDKISPKGDVNKLCDPTISEDQIVGKVVLSFSSIYLIIFICLIQIVLVLTIFVPEDWF